MASQQSTFNIDDTMLTQEQKDRLKLNVKSRIAIAEAVEAFTGLYVETSASLSQQFGIDTAETFLRRLCANMHAILNPAESKEEPEPEAEPSIFDDWIVEWDCAPSGYVLASIEGVVRQIREKSIAFDVGGNDWIWMPITQVYDSGRLFEGQQIDDWPIRRWIAEDKGLEYYTE
tara:strand:- start:2328 stop:2849 length:522 start_codon:yes stop_codon:yes gene_type:complete